MVRGWRLLEKSPPSLALMHHTENIGENFGDGAKQMGWNFLPDVDRLVKGLRQGRVFDNWDLICDANLTNTKREVILSLSHHLRSGHGLIVITQSDGVMSGIDDDGGSDRDLFHHVAPRQIPLEAPDAILNLRVPFRFARFVPQLLLAHSKFAEETAALPEEIQAAKRHNGQSGFQ